MSQRRKLRSGGACYTLENIFKTDHFKEILPPTIYSRITNTPTISCDKIRDLKIEINPDHAQNLKLMKQAVLQFTDLKSSSNVKYFESDEENSSMKQQKKNEMQMQEQAQQYGQELLNINFLRQIDQFIMQ